MLVDDWHRYLDSDESLIWSGASSIRYAWRTFVFPILFFGLCAYVYGNVALSYDSLADYCSATSSQSCKKLYFFRWPGFIVSAIFVSIGVFVIVAMPLGWVQHSYALTERRALQVVTAPWRKGRGTLLQAQFREERPKKTWSGIRFGSGKFDLKFVGLSQNQCDAVLSLTDDLIRVQHS
jgi:hypothetical protein